MITILVAMDKKRAIGKNNSIPWKLASDLRAFSRRTKDGVVIMGRKTWESLPAQFRPLPERTNIVITSQKNYYAPGAFITDNLEHVLNTIGLIEEQNVFVIGGAQIYEHAITHPYVDKLIISHVDTIIDAPDAFFPAFDQTWKQIGTPVIIREEHDEYSYVEKTYIRQTEIKD